MEDKIIKLIVELNNEVEFYGLCIQSVHKDSPRYSYYEGRIAQLHCDIDLIKKLSGSNGM